MQAITMPPLRERREDIPLLATYFVAKYGSECKRRHMGISAEVRTCLVSYDWPGNVRELQNAIERAVVMATHDVILPEDLPEAILEGSSVSETHVLTRYHETLRETKKQLVLKAFEQTGGSHVEAARLLGVHPQNLYRLIRTLNLKSIVS
jgi:transcriptional regulator with PAS, ATPase and Fis domain